MSKDTIKPPRLRPTVTAAPIVAISDKVIEPSPIAANRGKNRTSSRLSRTPSAGASIASGRPVVIQRPVLEVQAPGHPPRYGMFFGTAAIYQGIQYFHRKVNSKGLKGEIGPGLTILRFLWAAMRQDGDCIPVIPMSIALDHHPPRQLDTFVLLVSTLERLFLGLYPFWGEESGPLHYTALRVRPQRFLRALPSILRGRRGSHGKPENGYYSHNVREIQLTLDSGFTLDGQLYTPETRQQPTVVRHGGTASFLRIE